jgi:hypothetical protein
VKRRYLERNAFQTWGNVTWFIQLR